MIQLFTNPYLAILQIYDAGVGAADKPALPPVISACTGANAMDLL
jgi:hypothetical protein